MNKKIGIIGLGTVGKAVFLSLKKHHSLVYQKTLLNLKVVKVSDVNQAKRKIVAGTDTIFTTNPYDLINDPEIDIIVELIGGIEPANYYIIDSLKQGKNVVTANKALLASVDRRGWICRVRCPVGSPLRASNRNILCPCPGQKEKDPGTEASN